MAANTEIFGVYPMLLAFFDAGGSLIRRALERQVDALIEIGTHDIPVFGIRTEVNKVSTGELWCARAPARESSWRRSR